MILHLVDLHGEISGEAKKQKWDIIIHDWTDIGKLDIKPNSAFISPANSLGFMDGGVDLILSKIMFPGVETKVKNKIKTLGETTLLGRPFLQIGKALTVETQHQNVFLICAPTMWLPQDVRDTRNAYHAFYAALREASLNPNIKDLYFTGFCTGYGMMTPAKSIAQMKQAHMDFQTLQTPFSLAEIIKEQPKYYMNTEFKDITATELTHV
jgi:O-acetyl-ADP-ribose deacetylase (regulator of RNase III)